MLLSYLLLKWFLGAIIVSVVLMGWILLFMIRGLVFLVVAILVLVHARRADRRIAHPSKYASEEIRQPIEWAPFVNPELHENTKQR